MSRAPAHVLHVLPMDQARGGPVHARALRDLLDGHDRHRTLTLFASPVPALGADHDLGVPLRRWRRMGLDPGVVGRLRRAERSLRPDVVVAHGGETLKYAALARLRAPVVYYKIGTSEELANPFNRALYRLLVRRARMVAAVSEETADEVRARLGVPADRVVVVPNGRDPELYRPDPSRRGRVRPRLAFVGHVTETKRPGRFCQVVEAVRARGADVEAVLVGDGPLLGRLAPAAAAAGVELLGHRDDVPALLAGSDVFCFTSVVQGEGMPGVLIEAGLAGLPVVTTDVPGARAVVDDGRTGYVVAVDDLAAMVDAVHRLVVDPALRADMGERARARCLECFTIEASARQWQLLLDRVLGRETS